MALSLMHFIAYNPYIKCIIEHITQCAKCIVYIKCILKPVVKHLNFFFQPLKVYLISYPFTE